MNRKKPSPWTGGGHVAGYYQYQSVIMLRLRFPRRMEAAHAILWSFGRPSAGCDSALFAAEDSRFGQSTDVGAFTREGRSLTQPTLALRRQ